MSFSSGTGGTRQFEHQSGGNTLGPSWRDVADSNRARLLKGLETGPTSLYLAPNEGCVIRLGGVQYVSQRHPVYGFTWEGLPVREVNEFLQQQKLKFGRKGGKDWIQLNLKPVPSVQGGSTY
jgi:hypothetical protein